MKPVSHYAYHLTLTALALFACSPQTPAMTPEESKRLESLTARMTTRCVGRYQIEMPKVFVINSESRAEIEGVKVDVRPLKRQMFEVAFETRRQLLERKMQPGKDRNRPHLRKIIPLPDSLGVIFDRAESEASSDRSGRTFELMAWRDGFQLKASINATDLTFPEDADDSIAKQLKSDVDEKLAHLLDIYARLRGRNDDEIPKEQGVCFANGFLRGAPTDEERIDMYHHLDGVKDVYFTYHYFSHIGPEKTTLLQRGPAIEASLSKVNGKTLRKGSREVNGLKFEEWLLRRESSAGAMLYDHTLELNSKEGNAAKPLFTLDLTSGVEHPGPQESLEEAATKKPIQKSTLSEAESIALWDKVTATLRPRPGAF